METDSSTTGIVHTVDTATATVLTTAHSIATIPPSVIVTIPSTVFAPTVHVLPTYAKPFLDISRIEGFFGQNFKRKQERIYST